MPDSAIQFDQLLQRCMGNVDFADRLLTKFISRLPGDVDELKSSIQQGSPDEVARVAHRIKGACASVAADRMKDVAEELEAEGRGGQIDEPMDWMDRIESEADRLLTTVNQYQLERSNSN